MTDSATIVDALERARAELAAYLQPGDHNAEVTIAKLVGILEHRDVVRALQHAQTAGAPKSGVGRQRSAVRRRGAAARNIGGAEAPGLGNFRVPAALVRLDPGQ
jgi:hypothetical protein